MNQVPPPVQMILARKFIQDVTEQTLGNFKHMPQFIRGITSADRDKDGVVTGAELALAAHRTQDMLVGFDVDEVRKIGCNSKDPDVREAMGEILETANFAAARRLYVLANPKDVTYQSEEIARRWKMRFADAIEVSVMSLTPETNKFIEEASKGLNAIVNRSMIKTHAELVRTGEVGDLPKQVLPMTADHFCAAANSI